MLNGAYQYTKVSLYMFTSRGKTVKKHTQTNYLQTKNEAPNINA